MNETYPCPVCGFGLDEPARHDGSPSYEICPCCGFQPGFTDDDRGETYESWRAKWVAGGMQWKHTAEDLPPPGWDPRAQLASLGAN